MDNERQTEERPVYDKHEKLLLEVAAKISSGEMTLEEARKRYPSLRCDACSLD